MSPEFAAAVDPIFVEMVDLLGRIGQNKAGSVQNERARLDRAFRDAEANLGERPDWLAGKYALVAWIDETLKSAPWDGSDWWRENSLEFAYFNTNDAAVDFYIKAKEAGQQTQRDALEVFYVCVVLGFRGMYDLEERAFLTDQLQLPADVESWTNSVSRAIQLGQGRTRLQDTSRPIQGAPPLEGRFRLVSSIFWLIILLLLLAVLAYFLLPRT